VFSLSVVHTSYGLLCGNVAGEAILIT